MFQVTKINKGGGKYYFENTITLRVLIHYFDLYFPDF